MLTRILPLLLLTVTFASHSQDFELQVVAEDWSKPWGLTFLPNGDYLVTEHTGELWRLSADGERRTQIGGVPAVYVAGQGGLFDVILDPDFESNQRVFLSYAQGTPDDNGTAVASATLSADQLDDVQMIFQVTSRKDTAAHYGGRIAFLQDGTLLLTTGDGFNYRAEAQNLSSQLGKTLRMNADGSPAADNPFPQAPYVWTYGHRNPQGLAVTQSGDVYLHEHGPQGGDEINLLEPGNNYGWPAICFCLDYSGAFVTPYTEWEGMEQPIVYWDPSIAPSGFAIYEGNLFPDWQGDFFVGALNNLDVQHVTRTPSAKDNGSVWLVWAV